MMETKRLEKLRKYELLDTPPDGNFDKITALASKLFNMPIAIISLVDEHRVWFKSKYGIDAEEVGKDLGLCVSAIMSDEVYVVEDAKTDPRTLANPLVCGEMNLRFYAAAPLHTKDGFNLGTLCLIDQKQRYLNNTQKEMLQDLADVVMDEMEIRFSALQLSRELKNRISELEQENASLRKRLK